MRFSGADPFPELSISRNKIIMIHKNQEIINSIIIPCYNITSLVGKSLDSVLHQKNIRDCEIICVDDGSNDTTLHVLNKYHEKYKKIITVISNKTNHGVSDARNQGLGAARGRYVMFLDGDDTIGYNPVRPSAIDSTYLEKFARVMAQDSNIGMVIGGIVLTGEKEYQTYKTIDEFKTCKDLDKTLCLLDDRISSCATLYKNQIIKDCKLEFKPDLLYFEDAHFITSYAFGMAQHKNTLAEVPNAFYLYYRRQGSAMYNLYNSSEQNMRRLENVRNKIFYYSNLLMNVDKVLGDSSRIFRISANKLAATRKYIYKYCIKPAPNTSSLFESFMQYIPQNCRGCVKPDCRTCADEQIATGIKESDTNLAILKRTAANTVKHLK